MSTSRYDNSPRVSPRRGGGFVTDDGWELGFDGVYWSASHPTLGPFREGGELALYRDRDCLLRMILRDFAVAS